MDVQLHTYSFMQVDIFIEPQERHHLELEIPLLSISQLPIKLVQVSFGDYGFNFAYQCSGLIHRDPNSADVPPDPSAFQFHTGRCERTRHDVGSEVACVHSASRRSSHSACCASTNPLFQVDNLLTQSFDL